MSHVSKWQFALMPFLLSSVSLWFLPCCQTSRRGWWILPLTDKVVSKARHRPKMLDRACRLLSSLFWRPPFHPWCAWKSQAISHFWHSVSDVSAELYCCSCRQSRRESYMATFGTLQRTLRNGTLVREWAKVRRPQTSTIKVHCFSSLQHITWLGTLQKPTTFLPLTWWSGSCLVLNSLGILHWLRIWV